MSLTPLNDNNRLALDVQALAPLRQSARQESPEALKASAQQFESLFINMMLKSMRQATAAAGQEQSQDTQLYTSMLDQQLSQTMSQRGIGLADLMLRQLQRKPSALPAREGAAALTPGADAAGAAIPARSTRSAAQTSSVTERVQGFRQRMGEHAEEAARMTGLPSSFILGQAALESGWGRRQITAADGTPSHNLFGIKAGPGWQGKVVEVPTTEYAGGIVQRKVARFRAYDSYAEAFRDYASLLLQNPRYQSVLAHGQTVAGFAQGLQKAGYATDPAYADKLSRTIRRALSA